MRFALPETLAKHAALWQSGLRFSVPALLVFIAYQFYDLTFGYWAVATVAAVIQPTLALTWRKSLLRLLGTLIGVALAYLAVMLIKLWPACLLAVFFLGMFISSILIFTFKDIAYMGTVSGITFVFITAFFDQYPEKWHEILWFRTFDIILGLVIANACCYLLFRSQRFLSGKFCFNIEQPVHVSVKAAFLMACATTVSLIPWFHWHYPGGYWAPVACLFIVEESLDNTTRKGWARFVAHVAVMLVALIASFGVANMYGLAVALVLGMFCFGMWMAKPLWGFDAGMANTMGIGYSIVLLLAPTEAGVYSSMAARFFNTVLGIFSGIIMVYLLQRHFPHFGKKVD